MPYWKEPVEVWAERNGFYHANFLFQKLAKGTRLNSLCAHLPLGLEQMKEIFAVAQEILDE